MERYFSQGQQDIHRKLIEGELDYVRGLTPYKLDTFFKKV